MKIISLPSARKMKVQFIKWEAVEDERYDGELSVEFGWQSHDGDDFKMPLVRKEVKVVIENLKKLFNGSITYHFRSDSNFSVMYIKEADAEALIDFIAYSMATLLTRPN